MHGYPSSDEANDVWRFTLSETTDPSGLPKDRFRRLPEPIRPSEMLEEQQVSPPASFDGDRNVAQDDALRAGG